MSDAPQAEPSPVAAQAHPEAEADDTAEQESRGGLAAAVKQELEAAREPAVPPSAAAPVVPAGAPLVAVVAGVPVPRSAFEEIYALKVGKYVARGLVIPPSADRRYRISIVERLVHHERLRQRVGELGADYDPAALAARTEQQRRGIDDWPGHLERRGETEASLQAMIVAELREQLILERTGALAVSRAELEAEYELIKADWVSTKPRVRASHILVPIAVESPGDDLAAREAAARAEADRIHGLVTAPGADFAALAAELSGGPSRSKGGDIGIFTPDRMVEAFSDVAFAMKPGQISKPVQTKFGFHIIHVTGRWAPGPLPLQALEDQLVERLRERKLHTGRRTLKAELQAAFPVTHHLLTAPEQAEPAAPTEPAEPPRAPGSSPVGE